MLCVSSFLLISVTTVTEIRNNHLCWTYISVLVQEQTPEFLQDLRGLPSVTLIMMCQLSSVLSPVFTLYLLSDYKAVDVGGN